MNAQARGELLEFLGPGFLHGMCNALFKIQGQAQLLGRSGTGDSEQASRSILASCRDAVDSVEIFRLILEPVVAPESVPAGPLLREVAGLLRARLMDSGVQISWDAELEALPNAVRRSDVVLPLVTAMHRVHRALPSGFQGCLTISARMNSSLEIQLEVAPAAGCLPFDIDLSAAIRDANSSLDGTGQVSATESALGMCISIPTGAIA